MTEKEGAVISAFTGIMIGKFSDLHEYAEYIMQRSIFTHEFAQKEFLEELKEKSRKDFIEINNLIK